jgi:hypothetical protein
MASDIADKLDVSRPIMTRTGHTRLHAVLQGYYQIIDAFTEKQSFAP